MISDEYANISREPEGKEQGDMEPVEPPATAKDRSEIRLAATMSGVPGTGLVEDPAQQAFAVWDVQFAGGKDSIAVVLDRRELDWSCHNPALEPPDFGPVGI